MTDSARTHTATALQDGRALGRRRPIATSVCRLALSAQRRGVPPSQWWSGIPWVPLNTARRYHAAAALSERQSLWSREGATQSANRRLLPHEAAREVFDPVSLVWTATADLNVARSFHTMTLLPNGVRPGRGWRQCDQLL